ncbi:MAG: MFS transporter [Clostridiales bacterium]|nr:MFS transporter [Clostridiales bacterium]
MNFIKKNASLLAVSFGHFVNDFYMSIVPVVLFAFAIEMDLSAMQMSIISFVITTAGTFFQPLVGLLIDRVQKSSMLIYALILISIGMSLSGLINNYYLLIVVVGVAALGSSIYHPLGSTITIHKTSLSKGKSLSIFMTVGSFAHSAAPLVAIPMVTVYGVKSLSVLVIPGLLTVLLLYSLKVQDVTWTKEKHIKHKKRSKLTKKQQAQVSLPMTIAIIKGLLYRSIVVFGVIMLQLKGIDNFATAGIMTAFMIARATATLFGGFVSDAIGEKNTLKLFNTIAVIAVILLVFGTKIVAIIGLIVLGFTLNATAAANITLTHKIMPDNVNYGTGLIMGFAATLSAVAMLGYGYVVDTYGHITSQKVLVGIAVLMMLLSYVLPTKFKSLEQDVEEVI